MKLSTVKRLDFWTVVRTILENNPGIQAKFLILELRGKTRMSRSTIYDHLCTFDNQDRIYREKGKYYLPKDNPHLVTKIQRNSSDSPPKILFEITQQIYNQPNKKRLLPNVGANLFNINDYPIRVKVKARTILGGKNLGLIQDEKKYYSGETLWNLNPLKRIVNGNFNIQKECVNSTEEITIEIRTIIIGPDAKEYELLPESWTYNRKKNSWFFEPKTFTDDK